jgi:hypothetical protein
MAFVTTEPENLAFAAENLEDPCLWVGGPPHVNLRNNRFSRTPPLAGER